jgi:hypothetical protein
VNARMKVRFNEKRQFFTWDEMTRLISMLDHDGLIG